VSIDLRKEEGHELGKIGFENVSPRSVEGDAVQRGIDQAETILNSSTGLN
jgi:hypothetical protein